MRGSSQLALRAGISPLVVGLTVVAFGTSLPELLVSVQANMQEPSRGGLAVGNIVGSNICNIALVLAVGALISPLVVQRQVVRRELPVLLAACGVFAAMLWDRRIDRWEAGILAAGIVWYVWSSLALARREGETASDEISEEDMEEARKGGAGRIFLNVLLIVVGLAVLVAGADRLIVGGVGLAKAMGVPEVVIGLTMVALGTSLPELATSVVAAMKGEGDIITGNAIGSCIFNVLAVIGVAGLVAPLHSGDLTAVDLAVMLAVAALGFFFMWTRRRLGRAEGMLLLAGYLAYCGWRVF